MNADPQAALRLHAELAAKWFRDGDPSAARYEAIFAGIAAVKAAGDRAAEIVPPEDLAAEPFVGWFAEGVTMALDQAARVARTVRDLPPTPVRAGGNRAARALGEGGE